MTTETPLDPVVRYPRLTGVERARVMTTHANEDSLRAEIEVLQARVAAQRAERAAILDAAALRDVTIEEVFETFRTTGRGRADLQSWAREQHPAITGLDQIGVWVSDGVHIDAIGPTVHLTDQIDPGRLANEEVTAYAESLAQGLLKVAALTGEHGRLTIPNEHSTVDWVWHEHANGLHAVDIVDEGLSRVWSFMLGHSADGSHAVLIDQRRSWHFGRDEIAYSGTLAEVLFETLRFLRLEAFRLDDEY